MHTAGAGRRLPAITLAVDVGETFGTLRTIASLVAVFRGDEGIEAAERCSFEGVVGPPAPPFDR